MCVDSGRAWARSSGPSASRKESTDLLLRRKGARRRKLLGDWGICTRALWEGTTVSPGDSQGGTLARMLGSRSSSGENTGLSIPRREGSADQPLGSPSRVGDTLPGNSSSFCNHLHKVTCMVCPVPFSLQPSPHSLPVLRHGALACWATCPGENHLGGGGGTTAGAL